MYIWIVDKIALVLFLQVYITAVWTELVYSRNLLRIRFLTRIAMHVLYSYNTGINRWNPFDISEKKQNGKLTTNISSFSRYRIFCSMLMEMQTAFSIFLDIFWVKSFPFLPVLFRAFHHRAYIDDFKKWIDLLGWTAKVSDIAARLLLSIRHGVTII